MIADTCRANVARLRLVDGLPQNDAAARAPHPPELPVQVEQPGLAWTHLQSSACPCIANTMNIDPLTVA